MSFHFKVIDKDTGKEPSYEDLQKLAMNRESWCGHLVWTDIDCWAITEDGELMLTDDCGNSAYAPKNYEVILEED